MNCQHLTSSIYHENSFFNMSKHVVQDKQWRKDKNFKSQQTLHCPDHSDQSVD